MLGTFLGDTAAYFGGRTFGRIPLAPTISPNKTLEGLACGVIGVVSHMKALGPASWGLS